MSQSTVSNFLNGKPVDYANFIELCRVLAHEWRDIADLEDKSQPDEAVNRKAKVLISQRFPNQNLAIAFQQALTTADCEVLIAGVTSPSRGSILEESDYLLLLLCDRSAISELVLEEVRLTKETHHTTPQKPAILPIYIGEGNAVPLPFDLYRLLEGIQPWQWRDDQIATRKRSP